MHQHLLFKHFFSNLSALERLSLVSDTFAISALLGSNVSEALASVHHNPLLLFDNLLPDFDQIVSILLLSRHLLGIARAALLLAFRDRVHLLSTVLAAHLNKLFFFHQFFNSTILKFSFLT